MAIRKTPLFWTASLAAVAAGSLGACGEPETGRESADQVELTDPEALRDGEAAITASDDEAGTQTETAAAGPDLEGEGGEGGEGGEAGGEFGIDPAIAADDPVVYLSAIEVMRAHYLAGLAALEAGDRSAASEMFSHPVSEIYIDFEPVIEERGGTVMLEEMNEAAVLHFQGASDEEIRNAVVTVLELLDQNEEVAPAPRTEQALVDAEVLLDLADRAALQYGFAAGETAGGEAWLDAYGFNAAAQIYARRKTEAIILERPDLAQAIAELLVVMESAFSDYDGPDESAPSPQAVADAAEALRRQIDPPGDEATAP
ncbi:MAG: hypothetical protein ABL308_08855 [Oceanicaulis sp.]